MFWNNGLEITNASNDLKFKFGGRLHTDFMHILELDTNILGNEVSFNSGAEIRRARLYHSGDFRGKVAYKLQIDFTKGKASFKDAYVQFKKIPAVGSIQLG